MYDLQFVQDRQSMSHIIVKVPAMLNVSKTFRWNNMDPTQWIICILVAKNNFEGFIHVPMVILKELMLYHPK